MALTTFPENTEEINRKTSRDIRCEDCGQRRTIDGYDQTTVASCISKECDAYFVIPKYPFQNSEIIQVNGKEVAKELWLEKQIKPF